MGSKRCVDLGKELTKEHGLHAVILLPNDIFQHAHVSIFLLLLNKEKEQIR